MPAMHELTDNFQGTSVDTNKWTPTNNAAVVTQLDGQLIITPAPNTAQYGKIESNTTYDMTGSYCMVKQESLVAGSSTEQQLIAQIDEDHKLVIFYNNGGMICRYNSGAGNSDTFPGFDAARDRWWRIRESGGNTMWETSPDCVTWYTHRTVANPIAVTALLVEVQTGNYDTSVGAPGISVFSHFNLPAKVGFQRHLSGGRGTSVVERSK